MKRTGFEIGLTLLLAVSALVACRRTCGPSWGACCPATTAEATPEQPVAPEPVAEKADAAAPPWQTKKVRGLKWEAMNLDQVVSYLRTITGRNFYISPKVRKEKFDNIVINLAIDDVEVKALLDVITEPFDLRWRVRDDVVWILAAEELSAAKLRYYDVRDLITKAPGRGFSSLGELEDSVRLDIAPEHWKREDAVLEGRNGILIVRAAPAVLDGIDRYLRINRAAMTRPAISPAMRKKLEAIEINLAASNQTLGDLIKVLQVQTGMNLMIDPRFNDAAKQVVTGIKLESTPLWTALEMLAAAAGEGAVWTDKGNVVILTRADLLGTGTK